MIVIIKLEVDECSVLYYRNKWDGKHGEIEHVCLRNNIL